MIELIQFPWSPFCIVQRRILEFAKIPFKTVNIPNHDRSLVWRLSRQRYYGVPIIRDGRTVVFETDEDSQVIAKYLDSKFKLGLFPAEYIGLESILWRYIENQIEEPCFKLNDVHWKELVPKSDQLPFLRHKERKFGKGCIDQWRQQQPQLIRMLTERLVPFELMLQTHDFLLGDCPHFVDFDLYGMLSCYLFTGRYKLPAAHAHVNEWYLKMSKVKKCNT